MRRPTATAKVMRKTRTTSEAAPAPAPRSSEFESVGSIILRLYARGMLDGRRSERAGGEWRAAARSLPAHPNRQNERG